jgi:acylphosphatase
MPAMDMIARRVTVRGRVTGVGFRYATLAEASRYRGLAGYVRNADQSTVECVLQGQPTAVEAMVEWLRRGPGGAQVVDLAVEDIPVSPSLAEFRISR